MNIVLIQPRWGYRDFVGIPSDVTIQAETPSDFFEAFNGYGPDRSLREYARYSMSVGDIIGINGEYHLCESLGWSKLTEGEVIMCLTNMLNP